MWYYVYSAVNITPVSVNQSGLQIRSGRVAQSVTCLAADTFLTADQGVESSIPAQSHTFMEIDDEIICCLLQAKVCA